MRCPACLLGQTAQSLRSSALLAGNDGGRAWFWRVHGVHGAGLQACRSGARTCVGEEPFQRGQIQSALPSSRLLSSSSG